MNKRMSLADAENRSRRRKTQREVFLEKMERLIPWRELEAEVVEYYPKGESGKPHNFPLLSVRCYLTRTISNAFLDITKRAIVD